MPRWYPCKCCTGLIAAVFENFGPMLNHWNYCYCVSSQEGRAEPPEPYAFEFSNAEGGPSVTSIVYRPYGVRIALACQSFGAIRSATLQVEFAESVTRLRAVLRNRWRSIVPCGINEADTSPAGASLLWEHEIIYEVPASDFYSMTQNEVFRFRKADIVEHNFVGSSEITYPKIDWSGNAYLLPGTPVSVNAMDDAGDIVIVNPVRKHQLHSRDLSVVFSADLPQDTHALNPACPNNLTRQRVDAIIGNPFEFLVDGPRRPGLIHEESIAAIPEGPCQGAEYAGTYDSYAGISRGDFEDQSVLPWRRSVVDVIARGTFTSFTQRQNCNEETEFCGSGLGESLFSRPTLYFRVDNVLWSALAVDDAVQFSFGAKDQSPFWDPGWSWPAMNPGGFYLTNLNPVDETDRL